MLQLVNLLRLHLVLRFHILLPVLPTVIARHLGGGTSWSQNPNFLHFTHQVCWLARKCREIVRRCDHYGLLTRCWFLWVKSRSRYLLLWGAFPPLFSKQADHAAPLGKVQWRSLCQLFQFCERFHLLFVRLLLDHGHCGRQRLQVKSVNSLRGGESQT